jgi:hypothetical protein
LQETNWVQDMLDDVIQRDRIELVLGKVAIDERPVMDIQIENSPCDADRFGIWFYSLHAPPEAPHPGQETTPTAAHVQQASARRRVKPHDASAEDVFQEADPAQNPPDGSAWSASDKIAVAEAGGQDGPRPRWIPHVDATLSQRSEGSWV